MHLRVAHPPTGGREERETTSRSVVASVIGLSADADRSSLSCFALDSRERTDVVSGVGVRGWGDMDDCCKAHDHLSE